MLTMLCEFRKGANMARKAKLTPEERAERQRARCRAYWAEHREEIAAKRKIKREKDKAEKHAREKHYQEQAKQFLAEVQADEDVQNVLRAILEGQDVREVLTEYAQRKAETERNNG